VRLVADARVEPALTSRRRAGRSVRRGPRAGGADVGHDGALPGAVHTGHQHGVGIGGDGHPLFLAVLGRFRGNVSA
jgi:hypothetical protein